jgi:dephospho-CoA kinase
VDVVHEGADAFAVDRHAGRLVVVDAPADLRVRRMVEGRGLTEEDARARIAAQAPDDERRAAADVVLDGSGTEAELRAQVDRLWERVLREVAEEAAAAERA